LDLVRGSTALENLHERVGNAMSRSHACGLVRQWFAGGVRMGCAGR